MTATTTEPPARTYARVRYRLFLIELIVSAVVLMVFQWAGLSTRLAAWWGGLTPHTFLVVAGYLACCGAGYYILLLPLHFYGGFHLEHRFGLSRLTVAGWLGHEAKQLLVSGVIGLVLIEGLYALLRYAPTGWPLWATVGWVGFSVVLARVFPTLLLPMFYTTRPVDDASLVQKLLALCERVNLPALGVFRFDLGAETRKANAALAGLGGTRRVLVSDTLINEFTPEEIEGVLAHELAHHRFHHLRKLLVMNAVGAWLAFTLTAWVATWWITPLGLTGLSDIAGFPVLVLWLSALGLLGMPLTNGISRTFEWEADRFAVELTAQRPAFASALRRLAQLNLADPHPPRWVAWLLYDHPPIAERIAAAESAVV